MFNTLLVASLALAAALTMEAGHAATESKRLPASTANAVSPATEESNKRIVTKAFEELFNRGDMGALDRYWSSQSYVQHNPGIADGVDGLKQYIAQIGLQNLKVRINHVLAEGDLVLIHSEVSVGAVKIASIGFVRMDKGRLVEHWDTAQPVPESSANVNTMFSTKNSYQPRSKAQELANKKLVLGAYQALFGDHDLAALEHWADAYIQHNPNVADGKAGLRAALESFGVLKSPAHILDVRRVLADGNMVAVQTKQNFGHGDVSVIDLFRVDHGKIAEHWDVIQPVPAKAANTNTMF